MSLVELSVEEIRNLNRFKANFFDLSYREGLSEENPDNKFKMSTNTFASESYVKAIANFFTEMKKEGKLKKFTVASRTKSNLNDGTELVIFECFVNTVKFDDTNNDEPEVADFVAANVENPVSELPTVDTVVDAQPQTKPTKSRKK